MRSSRYQFLEPVVFFCGLLAIARRDQAVVRRDLMRLIAIALLLLVSLPALRAEEAAAGRAEELAQLVAPFVDHQTLAVIHADLATFDAVETVDALADFFHLERDTRDFLQSEIAPITVVSQSLPPDAKFDMFFVVSFSDLAKVPLFIVMPLAGARRRHQSRSKFATDFRAASALRLSAKKFMAHSSPARRKPSIGLGSFRRLLVPRSRPHLKR